MGTIAGCILRAPNETTGLSSAASRQRAKAKQGWRYVDLPVPHDVEIPDPQRVVDLLAGIG